MNKLEIYNKLADLLISFVGLEKGQNLVIKTEPIHKEIAVIVADCAYKMGARYCKIEFEFPELVKSRTLSSNDEYLPYIPKSEELTHDEYIRENWATIFLRGEEDPDLLAELSSKRKGIIEKKYFDSIARYQKARLDNAISWMIIVLPTPKWASRILGVEPGDKAVSQMWDKLIPIYKLDAKNPVEEWKKQAAELSGTCEQLNRFSFNRISYKGPGTDLTLTLHPKSRWITTKAKTASGATFYGNLPVEVFTTPDFRKSEGVVTTTRPVMVLNKQVTEARFEFRNGEVVSYDAKEGKDALTELFRLDPSAKFLGEAALIDIDSANYKSGLVFRNILLDEGASSHIALGGGIPPCIEGSTDFDKDEKLSNGINVSSFHIDFMIGSDEIDVYG